MHLVGEIQLLELHILEIVGHSKVHDQVHWLLGNNPLSNLDRGVRRQSRRMHSPASFPTGNPRDVSVLPVFGRAVPFHAVGVEVSARVLVDIGFDPCKGTDGLLQCSTAVAVPFGDVGVVLLVVGGGIEWPVSGVKGRQLQRLGHFTFGVFDVDLTQISQDLRPTRQTHLRLDQIDFRRRSSSPRTIRQLRSRMIRIRPARTPRQPLSRQETERSTVVTRQRCIRARLIDICLVRECSDIACIVRVWPHAFGCCTVACSTEVSERPYTGPETSDVVVSGKRDGDYEA
jgi:hypothetical protein